MLTYKDSGVNIEEGYKSVKLIQNYAKRTINEYVLNGLGSFGGMVELPEGYKKPVLVSGTDGVGTKLDIACKKRKYDTVGIDCVAMCVNDILCHGAKPLYFLDYSKRSFRRMPSIRLCFNWWRNSRNARFL